MILPILITFFAFVILIVLHELGHFLAAKRFGMRVDEFGFGFPPKIWSRKIGETLYSVNLLPLGGFVKIYGEDAQEPSSDPRSFQNKPLLQRFLVVVAGVVAFWIIAAVLLSFLAGTWGIPSAVSDEASNLKNVSVQLTQVLKGSPAEISDFKPLDQIIFLESSQKKIVPTKVKEVQEFIKASGSQEILVKVNRAGGELELKVIPNSDGIIGVGLARLGWQVSPWYKAPLTGIEATLKFTYRIIATLFELAKKLLSGQQVEGADVRGPIGIGELFVRAFQINPAYFVYFVSIISIYLAIFNLLPIPALDGGRVLFMVIEALRGRQVAPHIEAKIHSVFFFILLALILAISAVDILRLV